MTSTPSPVASPSSSPSSSSAVIAVVSAAFFVDMLTYTMVVPFLPLVAAAQGASSSSTGVLFGSYAAALLVGSWAMASLLRRHGTRRLMVGGLLGLVVTTVLYLRADSYVGLLVARTLQGVAAAATWTAGPAVLASSTSSSRRGRVLAVAHAGSALGTLLGPPVGGALYRLSPSAPFVVLVAVVVIALLGALRVLPTGTTITARAVPLSKLLRNPGVVVVGLTIAVGGGVMTMLEPVMPLYLARRFDVDTSTIGLLFGCALVCYAVAAAPVGVLADRFGSVVVSAVGLVASAAILPLLTIAPSVPTIAVTFAVLGIAMCFTLAPGMAAMATAVDVAWRGEGGRDDVDYATVYAIYNTAYAIGMFAGPVIGSGLVDVVDVAGAVQIVAVACALSAAVAWWARPGARSARSSSSLASPPSA